MYRWYNIIVYLMLKTKISHHKHSGHVRPHEYTSYGPLAMLLLVVGIVLSIVTVNADSGPGYGSIGLTGIMPGTPPKTAATIVTPVNQQHFSASPITVSGTCPVNTLVEIFKNNIFGGSVACSTTGNYSVDVDMLIGENVLKAMVYDSLNQAGPDSNLVTMFYDAIPAQASSVASLSLGGSQLLLNTDAVYRGIFPGQELTIPISILGGAPPYAINIQWGDSSNKIVPRNDSLAFNVSHTYSKPGTYKITIEASDGQSRVAYLTVAAVVNGTPVISFASTTPTTKISKILVLWPLYAAMVAIVISFWLGEKREKHILTGPNYRLRTQH